jgi:hypothetical protein
VDIKRHKEEAIVMEDIEFVLELLLRKKYVEKLERIIGKIRLSHKKDSEECGICADLIELDRFYSKAKRLFDEGI